MPAWLAAAAPYIASGAGAALGGILGGGSSSASKFANKLITSPLEDIRYQRFLPKALQFGTPGQGVEPALNAGLQQIGQMIQNPGQLSPNVADAIRQRLAMESEGISQNFAGIRANQAGAAARGNAPVSIRTALDSALDIAQERAQRGARREALVDSDALRRQDLQQTYGLLDTILQYIASARGQQASNLGALSEESSQTKASQLALIGSLLSSVGSSEKKKKEN